MFTKKTVFILGAGASIPYGLPSGAELVDRIISSLVPDQKENVCLIGEICKASDNSGKEEGILEDFRQTLAESRMQSIDAFLQHHRHFDETAKRVIAAMILSSEKPSSLHPEGNKKAMDWFPLMLQMLNASFNDFEKNSVSFITFNYDRSFEELLYNSLKSRERGKYSEVDWASRLKQCIPIIHLHGQVGQHAAFADDPAIIVKYGDSWLADSIRKASKEIRIVYENNIEQPRSAGKVTYNPKFSKSWQLLNDAEVICFLGLGYHSLNLKRLRIEEWNGVKIGTAYGLTAAHKEKLKTLSNGRILPENLGDDKQDCLTFMNESICLHKAWEDYYDDHPLSD